MQAQVQRQFAAHGNPPEYSITAYSASSDASSLRAAIYWWPVAFA
jgi:hypothetical protein